MAEVTNKEYLGQGAQFVVYKQHMAWIDGEDLWTDEFAVKQPKFNLDPAKPFNITEKSGRHHLDHMLLEISALTTPQLQRHPNIVKLISWTYDNTNFHHPIALVMELAISDLEKLLFDQATLVWSKRYTLCAQIASGIDAVHSCKLVHGDIKPKNILVFLRDGELVAKIADFGISVGNFRPGQPKTRLGGTPGWQAPEVEQRIPLDPEGLRRADRYSFGLLLWSTVFGDGKSPLTSSTGRQVAFFPRSNGADQDRSFAKRSCDFKGRTASVC
jgi:serine/threonine protein kinase